jgi:large subunit ribosomal protein L23
MKPHQIIKRPLLTEKGTQLKETGGQAAAIEDDERRSKVVFEVHSDANKVQIRQAIQALFSVQVVDVHTQVVRGKLKRMGRFVGRRPNWKKAIVTLAEGNKIEFFEGV